MGLRMMAKRKKAEPQPEQRHETPEINRKEPQAPNPETACHGPTSVERRQSDNWWKET